MGGAKALTAFSGAPHKPGTIYTANASEANAIKKRGTLTFESSSSCGNLILPNK